MVSLFSQPEILADKTVTLDVEMTKGTIVTELLIYLIVNKSLTDYTAKIRHAKSALKVCEGQ